MGRKALRVLEKRMLMKILEPKIQQPIRRWQDMHEELHCFYSVQILFRWSNK
jgi:hypothetical protein